MDDESQEAFESELVLGVDYCFMCSAKEQQQEKTEDHHSGKNDGSCTAKEDHAIMIANTLNQMEREECFSGKVMTPVLESNFYNSCTQN